MTDVADSATSKGALKSTATSARELQLALAAGAIPAGEKVRLITGDLHMQIVLVAKAVSSFWR